MNTLRETRPVEAAQAETGAGRPEGRGKSAEVILIPKQLRAEWMDAMAMDPKLSPRAFKVAGIIGSHFNRRSGETFIARDKIALAAGMCLRQVVTVIKEIEHAGYLIVKRRELPASADGTANYGGRGVANVYLPAIDGAQVGATDAGRRFAARIEEAWERVQRAAPLRKKKGAADCTLPEAERVQNSARKGAVDCTPTLDDPTDHNPTRARDGAAPAGRLGAFGAELEARLGAQAIRAWFAEIAIEGVRPGRMPELVLSAPSRFIADRILSHHTDDAIQCWNRRHGAGERVARLSLVVRGKSQGGGR